jgi:hypothetical protein
MQTGSGTHLTSYLTGTRGYFPGVKQPVREAKHSSQSSPEVKNAWSYTYTHQYTFMVWFSVKVQGHLLPSLPACHSSCRDAVSFDAIKCVVSHALGWQAWRYSSKQVKLGSKYHQSNRWLLISIITRTCVCVCVWERERERDWLAVIPALDGWYKSCISALAI